MWHASNKLLHPIPFLDAWKTECCVILLQHVVIVCPYALLLDPTLDIFVLFMRRKWVVVIVL
jgi:hypothetical protein